MFLKGDYTEEIKHLIEDSQAGNWIPFGMVVALLGIIGFLVMYIINQRHKQSEAKHSTTDSIMADLAKSQISTDLILKLHEKDIETIQQKISA